MPGYETFKSYFSGVLEFDSKTMDSAPLRKGSQVVGGTIIGEVGQTDPDVAPHLHFEIAPAGRGSHTIDPKPILDGWKLLEATAIYRAAGKNPFDDQATVGQVLLASKSQLQRQVLADPRLEIYSCGRDDIATGQIDRRVLAVLEYLVARGYRLTITSLKCGHSVMTTSGNVSAHSTGDAVDIAMVNGIPIYGNQGRGTITEAVINDLLKLQGSMEPRADHLADGDGRADVRDERPRRPHPRRLHPGRDRQQRAAGERPADRRSSGTSCSTGSPSSTSRRFRSSPRSTRFPPRRATGRATPTSASNDRVAPPWQLHPSSRSLNSICPAGSAPVTAATCSGRRVAAMPSPTSSSSARSAPRGRGRSSAAARRARWRAIRLPPPSR